MIYVQALGVGRVAGRPPGDAVITEKYYAFAVIPGGKCGHTESVQKGKEILLHCGLMDDRRFGQSITQENLDNRDYYSGAGNPPKRRIFSFIPTKGAKITTTAGTSQAKFLVLLVNVLPLGSPLNCVATRDAVSLIDEIGSQSRVLPGPRDVRLAL